MMMNSLSNGIVVLWLFLYFVSIFHKKLGGPDTEEVQMQNDTEDSLLIFTVSKVRLRTESKMVVDSLWVMSSNKMGIKS